MRVHVPATTSLVTSLTIPDERGGGLWVLLEFVEPGARWKIIRAIFEDGLDFDVIDHAADTLVERVVGWKRWEAAYVWSATLSMWPTIDGELTGRGVDVAVLEVGRATNTVYAWWRHALRHSKDGWKDFERDMQREPRRVIERAANSQDLSIFSGRRIGKR